MHVFAANAVGHVFATNVFGPLVREVLAGGDTAANIFGPLASRVLLLAGGDTSPGRSAHLFVRLLLADSRRALLAGLKDLRSASVASARESACMAP